MDLDPVLLSRLQWAWVIAWHILLPAFTVGLASYIAVLEGLYFFWARTLVPYLRLLDESFRRFLRDGRGLWNYHALPVRHELEPVHGCHNGRALAIDGL